MNRLWIIGSIFVLIAVVSIFQSRLKLKHKNTMKSMKLLKQECTNNNCYELISVGNKICIATSKGGIWCDDVGK